MAPLRAAPFAFAAAGFGWPSPATRDSTCRVPSSQHDRNAQRKPRQAMPETLAEQRGQQAEHRQNDEQNRNAIDPACGLWSSTYVSGPHQKLRLLQLFVGFVLRNAPASAATRLRFQDIDSFKQRCDRATAALTRTTCSRVLLRPQLLGCKRGPLRQGFELGEGDVGMNASAQSAIGRRNDALAANQIGEA